MRARSALLAIITALILPAIAAGAQRRVPGAQTTFGSEMPIKRPAVIPREVLQKIAESQPDFVRGCGGSLAGKLGAAAVDINGDGVLDLIVQRTDTCVMGAHATNFWVFSKTKTRLGVSFDLVLYSPGDGLEIGRAVSNAYRDISLVYATALEGYWTTWKFDGSKYQPRECFIEDFKTHRRRRTTCNREE